MKKRSSLFFLGLVVFALSTMALVYHFALLNSSEVVNESGNTMVSSASWAKSFNDLQTMIADSNLVVRGTIVGSAGTRLIRDANPSPKAEKLGLVPGVLFSDYLFRVEQVLKGRTTSNSILAIVQTGGTYKGVTYYIKDDPLFQVGERDILFLHDISGDPVQAPDEQKYIINGTPQARFKITDGRVVPLFPGKSFVSKFEGLREAEFVSAIQATTTTP